MDCVLSDEVHVSLGDAFEIVTSKSITIDSRYSKDFIHRRLRGIVSSCLSAKNITDDGALTTYLKSHHPWIVECKLAYIDSGDDGFTNFFLGIDTGEKSICNFLSDRTIVNVHQFLCYVSKYIEFYYHCEVSNCNLDDALKIMLDFLSPPNIAENTAEISTNNNLNESFDTKLWLKAVCAVTGDTLEKYVSAEDSKAKYALLTGRKSWPYEIKALYRALKYLASPCKCINIALEKVILSDMENESADYTDEQINASKATKLAATSFMTGPHAIPKGTHTIIKKAVKLAMSTENIAITRIYKGKHWDSEWHNVKCPDHLNVSNAAPPKKKTSQ